jgi:hypothetical protein
MLVSELFWSWAFLTWSSRITIDLYHRLSSQAEWTSPLKTNGTGTHMDHHISTFEKFYFPQKYIQSEEPLYHMLPFYPSMQARTRRTAALTVQYFPLFYKG